MNPGKYIFILLFLCFSFTEADAQKKAPKSEVELIQGDRHFPLTSVHSNVTLKREPFNIDFILKQSNEDEGEFHYARFVASSEELYFKYMKEGMDINETPVLADGTSMATNENNVYNSLFLIEGNHNFYYASEDHQRGGAKVIKKYRNGKIKLRWYIPDIYEYRQTPYPFTQLKTDHLYLIAFFDKDNDRVIDKGEYYTITLTFEKLQLIQR